MISKMSLLKLCRVLNRRDARDINKTQVYFSL